MTRAAPFSGGSYPSRARPCSRDDHWAAAARIRRAWPECAAGRARLLPGPLPGDGPLGGAGRWPGMGRSEAAARDAAAALGLAGLAVRVVGRARIACQVEQLGLLWAQPHVGGGEVVLKLPHGPGPEDDRGDGG